MTKLYWDHPVISVRTASDGAPQALCWRGAWYEGTCINHWRIETGWWEDQPTKRDFYLFDSEELLCEVYLEANKWHLHRIHD
jgi:hypothetical protein